MNDEQQNPDNKPDKIPTALVISKDHEADILKLAAVGLSPVEIAAAVEFDSRSAMLFVALAEIPGSNVSLMLARGRAIGRATPQMKLQEAANAGNIDAVKTLQKIQKENRFQELVNNMDNDEFTV